jgi:putative N-acetylmannosamine-6-phosphate epimerase
LNELTLDAFQHEVTTNILSTEFINVFTQYCDDSYSLGVSDINLIDFSEILLQLQSTSLPIIGIIKQNKSNALWKVLFDSGSDKTIVKRTSLPSGIETLTGKKHKILGVDASCTTDQDVLLKDITLLRGKRMRDVGAS